MGWGRSSVWGPCIKSPIPPPPPPPSQQQQQQYYCILEGITENSTTILEWRRVGGSQFSALLLGIFGLYKKLDGSQRMMMNDHKLHQMMTPNAAAVSLLEQMNTPPGTWYAAMDLVHAFSWSLPIMPIRSNMLSAGKVRNTPPLYYSGYVNSPAPRYSLVCTDLYCLSLPQGITPVHYIKMIGPSKQKAEATLDVLAKHLSVRGWEINAATIQGLSTLGIQWCSHTKVSFLRWRRNCCICLPLRRKKNRAL